MKELLDKIFDFDKIPTKLVLLFGLASGILLFVPAEYLLKLNLKTFVDEYGKFLGIIFLVSSVFISIKFVVFCYNKINEIITTKRIIKEIKKDCAKFSFSEIQILREFILTDKSTIQLPFLDESVISLENKRIIYKASNTGTATLYGQFWAYSISEYASPEITLEKLNLPSQPTEIDKQKIQNERPKWVK